MLTSSDGIGSATLQRQAGPWPREVRVLLNVKNLESLAVTTDRVWAHGSLKESGRFAFSLRTAQGGFDPYDSNGHRVVAGTFDIRVTPHAAGMEIVFPANLFLDTKEVTLAWIDAFRR